MCAICRMAAAATSACWTTDAHASTHRSISRRSRGTRRCENDTPHWPVHATPSQRPRCATWAHSAGISVSGRAAGISVEGAQCFKNRWFELSRARRRESVSRDSRRRPVLRGTSVRSRGRSGGAGCRSGDCLRHRASAHSNERFLWLPIQRADRETVLGPGDLVSAVILPAEAAGGVQRYHKLMQRDAWDFALVSVAGCRRTNGDVRIVLGGVAPRPYRVNTSIEEDVSSGGLDDEAIEPWRSGRCWMPLRYQKIRIRSTSRPRCSDSHSRGRLMAWLGHERQTYEIVADRARDRCRQWR